ncbi:MAG TPA: hypothetical protein VF014_07455, partial [Casimicrobiaceae bacterium]|nr:hypothetical protein [Casimicrobiaceae bacterium]
MTARILIIDGQRDSGRDLAQKMCLALRDAAVALRTRAPEPDEDPALSAYSAVLLACHDESAAGSDVHAALAELKGLLARPQCPPVIAIAAGDDSHRARTLIKAGAFDCVARENLKPATLAASLRQALKRKRSERAQARKSEHKQADPLGIP